MFTNVARIIAFFLCLGGVFGIALVLFVAFNPELSGRYFSSITSTGEMIDESVLFFGVGIFFGVLSEISRSIAKGSKPIDKEAD